jgi:threonine/homoserine/homoserine lactone efflux protein
MNLKVKAVGIVAGIFAFTIVAQGVIAVVAEKYGAQAILNTFVGAVLVFLIYQMYTLVLQRLQDNEKLKEMSDRG